MTRRSRHFCKVRLGLDPHRANDCFGKRECAVFLRINVAAVQCNRGENVRGILITTPPNSTQVAQILRKALTPGAVGLKRTGEQTVGPTKSRTTQST